MSRIRSRSNPVGAALLLAALTACAPKPAPSLPSALKYPDFLYPAVPAALASAPGADAVDRGWRQLQNDNLREAEQEFSAAARRNASLYPAQAGRAYVALARRDYQQAAGLFDVALEAAPTYVPAMVGRGQALLGLMREDEALVAFEAALKLDPSLGDLRRRIDVLRFRDVQQEIEAGRAAAAAGRLPEAKSAFERALAASPDSAFLHRELGGVERRQGNVAEALIHFRNAARLDPLDAVSLVQTGELLEQQMDFAGAEAAYRAASAIEPSADLAGRIAAVAARARDARLPAEYQAIPEAARVTRGDLAALIGVRLDDVVKAMPGREEVLTDIRGHWASAWITQVARAGILDAFENHTFQPRTPLRRVDLAVAISRLLTSLAATRPDLSARLATRPAIADVGTGHLNYPEVAAAVASGVLPLAPGDRFEVTRGVTGAEAVDAVARVRALASR